MKIIDQINKEIGPMFAVSKVVSWYRVRRNGKRYQYQITATYSTHCTDGLGSDGDSPQYAPRFHHNFDRSVCFDKSSEVNVEAIKKAIMQGMGVDTFEAAVKEAEKIRDESEAIMAARRKEHEEYERKEKEELTKALAPCEENELFNRLWKAVTAAGAETPRKLNAFALMNPNCLMDDSYRTEFLQLVENERVLQLAGDVLKCADPMRVMKDFGFVLRVNEQARKLGVGGRTIGAVPDAVRYLVAAAVA